MLTNTIIKEAEKDVMQSPRVGPSEELAISFEQLFGETDWDAMPDHEDLVKNIVKMEPMDLDQDDVFHDCKDSYESSIEKVVYPKPRWTDWPFRRPIPGNARMWDCAEMDVFPFGRLGLGFCVECNVFMGWDSMRLMCGDRRCNNDGLWHTYKTAAPDDCEKWFIPKMKMPRGRVGFKSVIQLDRAERPKVDLVYQQRGQMWVPMRFGVIGKPPLYPRS